jgi:hypothetical protein
MSEEKNINILKYWPVVVAVIMVVGTWARIQVHISDESIHLTEHQRNNITTFTAITTEKLPNIEKNHEDIELLKTKFAVFESEFKYLYEEHEGLESKVSRNYVELRNKLDE